MGLPAHLDRYPCLLGSTAGQSPWDSGLLPYQGRGICKCLLRFCVSLCVHICFGDNDSKCTSGDWSHVYTHAGCAPRLQEGGGGVLGHRAHGPKPSEVLFLPSNSTNSKSWSQSLYLHLSQSTGQDLKQQRRGLWEAEGLSSTPAGPLVGQLALLSLPTTQERVGHNHLLGSSFSTGRPELQKFLPMGPHLQPT